MMEIHTMTLDSFTVIVQSEGFTSPAAEQTKKITAMPIGNYDAIQMKTRPFINYNRSKCVWHLKKSQMIELEARVMICYAFYVTAGWIIRLEPKACS